MQIGNRGVQLRGVYTRGCENSAADIVFSLDGCAGLQHGLSHSYALSCDMLIFLLQLEGLKAPPTKGPPHGSKATKKPNENVANANVAGR